MRFILLTTFVTLTTFFRYSDQAVRPVTLFIHLFDVKGKRSTILDEGYKYTVGELKSMLVKEIDVSGHILRLYFEGQELWIPDRTLASYRVRPGDTVDIYLENIAEQLAIKFGNQDKSPDGKLRDE
ncbi:Ubiquitin-like domain-containing protein [Caenorhabditis elegans]|uniref:Ubiquitin-like domain-containing protein n=2 Tax=Caenorhabditis elegans TaxID=6239 RepID=Q7YTR2_CAEEL|nr:Ubiquitin-like domain-containing protein [Caenorhabditis elegans]CAE17728.1 Ubiquitin-like domain-containing protein [Caenorhabditis elegans]|eukprot:NP_001021335.1 Uncharacterized protein CELE_C28D4.10 [Caenorhabditis elegans]